MADFGGSSNGGDRSVADEAKKSVPASNVILDNILHAKCRVPK